MTTRARIRTSIAVIFAVFALLIASGLAVRHHASSVTAGQGSKATATAVVQPATAAVSGEEVDDDVELESD